MDYGPLRSLILVKRALWHRRQHRLSYSEEEVAVVSSVFVLSPIVP
jgi:hypothetical protein